MKTVKRNSKELVGKMMLMDLTARVSVPSIRLFQDKDLEIAQCKTLPDVSLTSIEITSALASLDTSGIEGFSNALVAVDFGTEIELSKFCSSNSSSASIAFSRNGKRIKDVCLDNVSLIKKCNEQYRDYKIFLASASQVRGFRALLVRCDILTSELVSILNKLSGYALDDATGKAFTVDKGIKLCARLAQHLAPNNGDMFKASKYAIYNGKFGDMTISGVADGACMVSIEVFKRRLAELCDISQFSKREIDKMFTMFVQLRPMHYCVKSAGFVQPQNVISTAVGCYEILGTIGADGKVTCKEQDTLSKLYHANNKGIILVGTDNIADVEVFVDSNALKMLPNFHKAGLLSGLHILKEIKKGSDNLCFQELSSVVINSNPQNAVDGMRFVISEMSEQIKELANFREHDFSVPKISAHPGAVVESVSNYGLEKDRALYVGKVGDLCKTVSNMVNRGRIQNKSGFYGALIPDPALLFNQSILKSNECYVGDDRTVSILTRLPKSNHFEALRLNEVSLDEILRRCKLLGNIGTAIYSIYKNAPSGVIMPAVEYCLALLGGSDFDGDTGKVKRADQDIAKFMDCRRIYPIVHSGHGDQQSIEFSVDTMGEFISRALNSGNKPVGIAVNEGGRILALLAELVAGKYVPARIVNVLKAFNAYGIEFGDLKYKSPLQREDKTENGDRYTGVHIHPDSDAAIEIAMTGMSPSYENLFNALEDLALFNSAYIMRTIDSAKTGEIVKRNCNLYKHVVCAGVSKSELVLNQDDLAEINSTIYKNEVKPHKVENEMLEVLELQDWIGNIKANGFNIGKTVVNDLMDKAPVWQKTDVDKLLLECDAFNNNSADIRGLFARETNRKGWSFQSAIEILKSYYNDLSSLKKYDIADSKGSDEERAISAQYRQFFSYLRNTVKLSLNSVLPVTGEDCYRICKYASFTHETGLEVKGTSRFAETCLPEEYLQFIMKYHNESGIDFMGNRITCNLIPLEEGDIISLSNGVNFKDGIAVEGRLNGEFTVREFNSELYATKLISELYSEQPCDGKVMFRIKKSKDTNLDSIDIEIGDILNIDKTGYQIGRNGSHVCNSDAHNKFLSLYKNKDLEVVNVLRGKTAREKNNGGYEVMYVFANVCGENVIEDNLDNLLDEWTETDSDMPF